LRETRMMAASSNGCLSNRMPFPRVQEEVS
jgi:hypothetical protein